MLKAVEYEVDADALRPLTLHIRGLPDVGWVDPFIISIDLSKIYPSVRQAAWQGKDKFLAAIRSFSHLPLSSTFNFHIRPIIIKHTPLSIGSVQKWIHLTIIFIPLTVGEKTAYPAMWDMTPSGNSVMVKEKGYSHRIGQSQMVGTFGRKGDGLEKYILRSFHPYCFWEYVIESVSDVETEIVDVFVFLHAIPRTFNPKRFVSNKSYGSCFREKEHFIVHSSFEIFKICKNIFPLYGLSFVNKFHPYRKDSNSSQIWSKTFWKIVNPDRDHLIFKNMHWGNIRRVRVHSTSRFEGFFCLLNL